MRSTNKQIKRNPAFMFFSLVMHLLCSRGRQRTLLLIAASMSFPVAAGPMMAVISSLATATATATTPGLKEPYIPPSQIAALTFAYHTVATRTCKHGVGAQICADSALTDKENSGAIIRTDYRVTPNGTASLWMELLEQPQTASTVSAPITHTTVEFELISTPEGKLVTTASRTLTSETQEIEINLKEALTESRLKGIVYQWLMLFEQPNIDEKALLTHIQPTTTLYSAAGSQLTGHEQISNWYTAWRQDKIKVRQQADAINITLIAPRRYRLDFAVDWQARGTDGELHIGRKEYRWEVELSDEGVTRITHIQEQDALPMPTGTRVYC